MNDDQTRRTSEPVHRQPSVAAAQDERIGLVRGDRLCQQCAYNLTGQPVLREQHYQMLIVRCPECGSVAAIQQQPVLAQWLGKLHGLWLVMWTLLILILGFGGTAALAGIAYGVASATSFSANEPIRQSYLATLPPEQQQTSPVGTYNPSLDFDQWWAQQDIAALRQELGGFGALIRWPELLMMLTPHLLLTFALGTVWAAVLIHWRRKGLILWWIIYCGILLVWTLLFQQAFTPSQYSVVSIWRASEQLVGKPILWAVTLLTALVLLPSIVFGRSVMRIMIRYLLPPRMQASLSTLWRTDGLEPPPLPRPPMVNQRG